MISTRQIVRLIWRLCQGQWRPRKRFPLTVFAMLSTDSLTTLPTIAASPRSEAVHGPQITDDCALSGPSGRPYASTSKTSVTNGFPRRSARKSGRGQNKWYERLPHMMIEQCKLGASSKTNGDSKGQDVLESSNTVQTIKICAKLFRARGPPKPQRTHANQLLRLMDAEFSDMYFPRLAVALRTRMISMQNTSVASNNVFGNSGVVEHLDATSRNSSVFIVMHGHEEITTNMHPWVRRASRFDSLSIYIACCIQATRVSYPSYFIINSVPSTYIVVRYSVFILS